MTKKEIIDGLKFTVAMFLLDPSTGETITEPRNDMDKTTIDACKGAIELLEQEPKTGHWIKVNDYITTYDRQGRPLWGDACECSECKFQHTFTGRIESFKFCPKCGCPMEIER